MGILSTKTKCPSKNRDTRVETLEVYYNIDFSRPSPENKSAGGIHYFRTTGLGAIYVAIPRNRGFATPKSESPIRRYRAEAVLNTDSLPLFHHLAEHRQSGLREEPGKRDHEAHVNPGKPELRPQ